MHNKTLNKLDFVWPIPIVVLWHITNKFKNIFVCKVSQNKTFSNKNWFHHQIKKFQTKKWYTSTGVNHAEFAVLTWFCGSMKATDIKCLSFQQQQLSYRATICTQHHATFYLQNHGVPRFIQCYIFCGFDSRNFSILLLLLKKLVLLFICTRDADSTDWRLLHKSFKCQSN